MGAGLDFTGLLAQAGLGDPVVGFLIMFASMALGMVLAIVAITLGRGPPRRGEREESKQQPPRVEVGEKGGVVVKGDMMLPATAYQALRDLSGCRGVLVVESGRVLCVVSDEEARVVWPPEGE